MLLFFTVQVKIKKLFRPRLFTKQNNLSYAEPFFPIIKNLILSGLLIEDQDDIISLVQKNNWQFIQSQPLDGWVSLLFNKA